MIRTFSLFCSLLSMPVLAAVNAQVNVHSMNLGETVQLTLEADQKIRQNPDLSVLTPSFRIVGSKQMTISSYSSGEPRYTTRWQILLRPLKSGSSEIPAIRVGDETTTAIPLTVAVPERSAGELPAHTMLLETELDTNELYLQSQAILTVKLFHQDALPEKARLAHPNATDAVIKSLGEERRYQTRLRGQTFHVLERRYGVFPQQVGLVQLEPIIYNDGTPGAADQTLQKSPTELAVLSPAQQQTTGYWLPATKVSLTDNLEPRSSTHLGTPIVRRITLTARGILASELPSLTPLKNELADIRLDNVILEEDMTEKGVVSSRTEELTITPYERGEITLTPIRIPWWDVSQDRAKQVDIGSRLIDVAAPIQVATPATPSELATQPAQAPVAPSVSPSSLVAEQTTNPLLWLLTGLAVISTLGWLYTYRRMRQRQIVLEPVEPLALENSVEEIENFNLAEAASFDELSKACSQNHGTATRLLLVEWGQQAWPDEQIFSCEDVAYVAENQTLQMLVMDLEHHLNHGEEHLWKGDLMQEALDKVRERTVFRS